MGGGGALYPLFEPIVIGDKMCGDETVAAKRSSAKLTVTKWARRIFRRRNDRGELNESAI